MSRFKAKAPFTRPVLFRTQTARMATAASTAGIARTTTTTGESKPYIVTSQNNRPATSSVLHRTLKSAPPQVVAANGKYLTFSNGQTILDTTCGAAVACIGSGNQRVKKAMIDQLDKFAYCNSMFFGHPIGEELAKELINGTDGAMSKAYIMCSGSEAMEAAMKMARQYFMETQQPERINFIAREGSYHGTTLGSLSMSGHVARRSLFNGMLLPNIARVSACNAYRGMREGQTVEEYVEHLADELDQKFQQLGPETVCAFVAEPVVGAALGCVPAVPGYFKAMRHVCDKYGALLILDEVMSGMGRCGSLHAWQQEGVVPDIQTMAKGLGGGYAPVAGMMINHRVAVALGDGTGAFSHGHTYQGHPVGCAAALEVQRIIREEKLVANVQRQGALLERLLKEFIGDHPHVGNIRGKGLFWGIEFVAERATKEPFPRSADVANKIHLAGLNEFGISLYPGNGSKDGVLGDHVLIAPAYTSTEEEILDMAERTRDSVNRTFQRLYL